MIPVVCVIEDDEALRTALTRLLEAAGMRVQGFASAEAFLSAWRSEIRGCAVVDLDLPGMNGLELQAKLAERGVEMPMIFLTGQGDVPTSVRALKAGAFDFLEKPASPQLLLERVRGALAHERRLYEVRTARAGATARLERLTGREREILPEVVAGRSNRDIALRLGISFRTVELHRAHIMEKTGARNAVGLARLIEQCGWAPGRRDAAPGAEPTPPPSRRTVRG